MELAAVAAVAVSVVPSTTLTTRDDVVSVDNALPSLHVTVTLYDDVTLASRPGEDVR